MTDRRLIIPQIPPNPMADQNQIQQIPPNLMQPSAIVPYILKENVYQPPVQNLDVIPNLDNIKYHISYKKIGNDYVWFIFPLENFMVPPTNATRIYPTRLEKVYNSKLNMILTHPVTFYETTEIVRMQAENRLKLNLGLQSPPPVNASNNNQSQRSDAATETVIHISPNSTAATWKKSQSPDFQSFQENLESNQPSPFLNFSSDKVWRFPNTNNDSLLLRSSTPDLKNKQSSDNSTDSWKNDSDNQREVKTKDSNVQTDDWNAYDEEATKSHSPADNSYANIVQKNLATLKIENDKQTDKDPKSTQIGKKSTFSKFKFNKQTQFDQNKQQVNYFVPHYKRKFSSNYNPKHVANNNYNPNSHSRFFVNTNYRNQTYSNKRDDASKGDFSYNKRDNAGKGDFNYNKREDAGKSNFNYYKREDGGKGASKGAFNYNKKGQPYDNKKSYDNGGFKPAAQAVPEVTVEEDWD